MTLKNQKFTRFNFGFLNNAQDPTALKIFEASECNGIDADFLALGQIKKSDYTSGSLGVKDWTTSELNGRNFRLNSGVLQFEADSGDPGVWRNVGDLSKPSAPSITAVTSLSTTTLTGSPPITTISFRRKPGVDYTGPDNITFVFTITANGTPDTVGYRYGTDDPTNPSFRNSLGITGGWQDFYKSGEFQFMITPTTGHTINDSTSLQVNTPSLVDGEYSYLLVNVNNKSSDIVPLDNIQSIPSDITTFTIDNLDGIGDRIASVAAQITVPANNVGSNIDEVWLFRKDPNSDKYIRVYVNDTASPVDFDDTVTLSSLKQPVSLGGLEDESFSDLNDAIGNSSGTFEKLFEKDGRLWLVPTDREDLVMYSRQSDFWGWQRINSFSFDGEVQDIDFIKDITTVGGQITTVVFTDENLYHISGVGSDSDTYKRQLAYENVSTEPDSVVNLNGILAFLTKSTAGGYDEGPYGQKAYLYDLSNLVEISAKVRFADLIESTNGIQYANLIGGDKYLVKKTSVDSILVYHKDAENWVETTSAVESSGLWSWKSKVIAPQIGQWAKIASARKYRIDFIGTIKLDFYLDGAASPSVSQTITQVSRGQQLSFLPNLKGRKWQFKVSATADDTILYQFDFVT